MQLGVFALVVTAAFMHASWNATLRDVKGSLAVSTLSGYFGGILALLGAGAHALWVQSWSGFTQVISWNTAGLCCILSALVHTAYKLLLSYAYRDGDLSVLYPIARGSGVALTAILSVSLTHEAVAIVVCQGIAAVVLGIILVGLSGLHGAAKSQPSGKRTLLHGCETPVSNGGPEASMSISVWSLLWQVLVGCSVGLIIASYQIIDKTGVTTISTLPIAYTGLMCLLTTVMSHIISPGTGVKDLKMALFQHGGHICFIGSASVSCYCIITFAMQVAPVAIVSPLRESSVLFGAILGLLCFGEPCNAMKVVGLVLMLFGMVTVKLS